MKIQKKIIGTLKKCYCVAPLRYEGKQHILVAAEKQDACYMFDLQGNKEAVIWEKPGGVMSMVQVPGSDGIFLATHKFYSPNDSKEARIVIVTPMQNDTWEVRTLAELPHVHRFGILTGKDGQAYLIACTLKSGHQFQDDWSSPGKVYAAALPKDLSKYHEGRQLELTVIKEGLLKNHGYWEVERRKSSSCLISCENGVFLFKAPDDKGGPWTIEQLIQEPGSDAVLADMDADGEEELAVISPFHGNAFMIYKKRNQTYEKVYQYDNAKFAHAIYSGSFLDKQTVIIGCRGGERGLLLFTWNPESGQYEVMTLDKGGGAANIWKYSEQEKEVIIAANREKDEIAMYICEK